MNRQEPYIGMPIHFDDIDDGPTTCCGQKENACNAMPRSANQTMRQPAESMQNMQSTQSMPNMQPMALAMAYVPWQRWTEPYPLEDGFERGTIFPDLSMPFEGRRMGGMRR